MNAETNILSMTDLQHTALISGNKAMQLLELSRHSFEKVVKEGLLTVIHEGGKKYYQIGVCLIVAKELENKYFINQFNFLGHETRNIFRSKKR